MTPQPAPIPSPTAPYQPYAAMPAWTAPPYVAEHSGAQLPADADFFVAPPLEIGGIYSAHTSLRKAQQPKSMAVRVAIALACEAGGIALAMGIHRFTGLLYIPAGATQTPVYLWAVIFGLLPAYIGWRKSRFRHFCNYVGQGGCAQFRCE